MNIKINDRIILEISDIQKKVLCDHMPSEKLEANIEHSLKWVVINNINEIVRIMRNEWNDKLIASGVKAFPVDDEEYAKMVFAHPEYKSIDMRIEERAVNRIK